MIDRSMRTPESDAHERRITKLADRLRLGYVVDFVDIGLGTLRFFTFNVGDSAITLAILMLIAAAIFPTLSGVGDRSADG